MAEPLPVVEEGGEVGDGHDEEGRHVHRHHLAQDHATQLKLDHHSPAYQTWFNPFKLEKEKSAIF